jgi:hypothetical protein
MKWVIEKNDCKYKYVEAEYDSKPFMNFWLDKAKRFTRKRDAKMFADRYKMDNYNLRKV